MDDNEDYIDYEDLPRSIEEIRQFYDKRPTGYSTDELLDIGTKLFLLMKDTVYFMDKLREGELKKLEAQKLVGERVNQFVELFVDKSIMTTRVQHKGKMFMSLFEDYASISELDWTPDFLYDVGQIGFDLFDSSDAISDDDDVVMKHGEMLLSLIGGAERMFWDYLPSFYLTNLGHFFVDSVLQISK